MQTGITGDRQLVLTADGVSRQDIKLPDEEAGDVIQSDYKQGKKLGKEVAKGTSM